MIGNHDQLVQGSVSAIWPNGIPDSSIPNLFPGIDALITTDDGCLLNCFDFSAKPSDQVLMIQNDQRSTIALGTYAEAAVVPTATPVTASEIGAGEVAADPVRYLLTENQWMAAFFNSSSQPVGHGMTTDNLVNDTGCYVHDPVPGIPIRIIAVEMVSKTLADGSALATLRRTTFDNFVVPQLDKALQDNALVVLISHHQSWSFPPKGLFTPYPFQGDKRDLTGTELVDKINAYPNVVLHLVGHGHENQIKPHVAQDDDPLKGYWEVETCSSSFWPQQARIVEIVDNRDGTGTVYSTMLDYDIPAVALPDWPHKNVAAQVLLAVRRANGLRGRRVGGGGGSQRAVAFRDSRRHPRPDRRARKRRQARQPRRREHPFHPVSSRRPCHRADETTCHPSPPGSPKQGRDPAGVAGLLDARSDLLDPRGELLQVGLKRRELGAQARDGLPGPGGGLLLGLLLGPLPDLLAGRPGPDRLCALAGRGVLSASDALDVALADQRAEVVACEAAGLPGCGGGRAAAALL